MLLYHFIHMYQHKKSWQLKVSPWPVYFSRWNWSETDRNVFIEESDTWKTTQFSTVLPGFQTLCYFWIITFRSMTEMFGDIWLHFKKTHFQLWPLAGMVKVGSFVRYFDLVTKNFVTQNNFDHNFDPCHFEACHFRFRPLVISKLVTFSKILMFLIIL